MFFTILLYVQLSTSWKTALLSILVIGNKLLVSMVVPSVEGWECKSISHHVAGRMEKGVCRVEEDDITWKPHHESQQAEDVPGVVTQG